MEYVDGSSQDKDEKNTKKFGGGNGALDPSNLLIIGKEHGLRCVQLTILNRGLYDSPRQRGLSQGPPNIFLNLETNMNQNRLRLSHGWFNPDKSFNCRSSSKTDIGK